MFCPKGAKTEIVFNQLSKQIMDRRKFVSKINNVISSLDGIDLSLQLSLPNLGEIWFNNIG